MFGLSVTELLIILAIVLLLFGTKRLRNLGGDGYQTDFEKRSLAATSIQARRRGSVSRSKQAGVARVAAL